MKQYIFRDRDSFSEHGMNSPFSCERVYIKPDNVEFILNVPVSRGGVQGAYSEVIGIWMYVYLKKV